jgi:hypothetical protein
LSGSRCNFLHQRRRLRLQNDWAKDQVCCCRVFRRMCK